MESHAVFESNLARMRRRHAWVARLVESAPLDAVELVTGPRGARTVAVGGALLASAYDPRGEGEKLADEMAREPADLLVAIGFGLGHHLESYRQRNPCPIVVYEPSPERLRAALSTRAIPLLERPDVHLTSDLGQLSQVFGALYTPGLSARIVPHPSLLSIDPGSVREAVERISRTKSSRDITAGTRVRMAAPWAAMPVDNLPDLVASASWMQLAERFQGVPAVVCAAGPSLDKQLPKLREVADRVVVVSIGQTLRSLRRAGIEPDFVHLVESQDVRHQLTDAGDTSDLNLVLVPNCHPELFALPVRSRWVAWVQANQIGCWIARSLGERRWLNSGGTVAQTSVFLADVLGCDPVILIGQDLAYTDGRAYAADSAYDGVGFRVGEDGGYELTDIDRKMRKFGRDSRAGAVSRRKDLVWVPGWNGGTVPTSPAYASFRENYRDIGLFLKSRRKRFVNCTEGGARIPQMEHQAFEELLATLELRSIPKQGVIRGVFDSREDPDREKLTRQLERTRCALRDVEREVQSGLRAVESAPRELGRARTDQRKIDVLRRIGRYEKKVRRRLESVEWLDALVQAGIHQAIALARAGSSPTPTPEQAVEEARQLFETTAAGVDLGQELLVRFEERLSEVGLPREERRSPQVSVGYRRETDEDLDRG